MHRVIATLALVALAATGLSTSPAAAATLYPQQWVQTFDGWNRSSSPVIADIDADGENEVVMGHQDGILRAYEADGSLKWATAAVPGVPDHCNPQGTPTAIDSSPAVADLDRDGTPEVVIGVGSTWVANQNGGVLAFDGVTGAVEWRTTFGDDRDNIWTNTGSADGWCDGVYATPAIGDVDGDGHLDVVYGSWDQHVWVLDRNGDPLNGFPWYNDDTIWSSAALFDLDGDGDLEIFVGGDTTPGGSYDHLGGVLRAIDVTPSGVDLLWNAEANEVFHSSPAIGDINNDGRMDLVIGTGHNWRIECSQGNAYCGPGDGSDTVRVFAFHLDDGSPLAGWPVSTGGTVIGSPALGDIDDDGELEVVIGSEDTYVYAWNGDGSLLWRVQPDHAHFGPLPFQAGPAIADLQGDGGQDVAIGSSGAMQLLDGRTGAGIEASLPWNERTGFARSYDTTPAIGVLDGERHLVLTGFDTPSNTSRLAAYRLPDSSAVDDWPMFRRDAARNGVFDPDAVTCGFEQSGTFCDVATGAFYEDAVAWMVAEGITTGVSNFLFGPNQTLTRAQMVTFLWREAGSPTGNPDHGFGDVTDSSYYAEAVRWAKANGITTGTSSTTFSPNDDVTRGQLVTLLWRREGQPNSSEPMSFNDVPDGRYFTPAVGWAKANGITTGTSPATFSPNDPVTRGQAAAFVHRTAGEPAA